MRSKSSGAISLLVAPGGASKEDVGSKPVLVEVMLLGSSLRRLERAGSADRERDYYRRLAGRFDVRIFGYEQGDLRDAFSELPVSYRSKWIQSVLGPFAQRKTLSGRCVIRTKQLWGCWAGWILARLSRKPLIIRCGYIWSRSVRHQRPGLPSLALGIIRTFEALLVRSGDAFIFATDEIAAHYAGKIGDKPFLIAPNGYDLETFRPHPEVEKEFDYAYVGRLIPLKGISDLLKAVPEGRRLMVVGDGELAHLAKNHPRTEYFGMIPNYQLPRALARARCFVSLSRTEGNPKCLYEAVLCGLYPVLSDIPAHRSLVERLGYGRILAPGEVLPDPAQADSDPVKLEKFRAEYGFEGIVDREAEFCEAVMDGRAGA